MGAGAEMVYVVGVTLQCNTRRSTFCYPLRIQNVVQFDSDYSSEDDAHLYF